MDIKKSIDFVKINKLQNFSDTMIALGRIVAAAAGDYYAGEFEKMT